METMMARVSGGWSRIWISIIIDWSTYIYQIWAWGRALGISANHMKLVFWPFLFLSWLPCTRGWQGWMMSFQEAIFRPAVSVFCVPFHQQGELFSAKIFRDFSILSILVALAVEHHRTQQGKEHLPENAVVACSFCWFCLEVLLRRQLFTRGEASRLPFCWSKMLPNVWSGQNFWLTS